MTLSLPPNYFHYSKAANKGYCHKFQCTTIAEENYSKHSDTKFDSMAMKVDSYVFSHSRRVSLLMCAVILEGYPCCPQLLHSVFQRAHRLLTGHPSWVLEEFSTSRLWIAVT